jgi:alpha-tubulin suppressor-like RCC1 family protein
MKKVLYFFGFLLLIGIRAFAQCPTFTTLASGSAADHALAIRNDGTLWAWGANTSGQLGDGSIADKNTPVQIGVAADWARISAGSLHSLGIRSDGTLWAWGNNESGQLGDGSNETRLTPVQIGSATTWVSVKAGAFHSIGIRTDGTLWTWGINSNGELGTGDNTSQNMPVQIAGAADWVSISAGSSHSLGIRSNGSLWTWGDNQYGQLGDGSNADKNVPVQVASGGSWVNVSGGGYHSLAIKSGGTLWAWGRNDKGQLGTGTYTNTNTPAQIGNHEYYTATSAGMYHSSVIGRGFSTLFFTWGSNEYQQIGNGSGSNTPSPYHVAYSDRWVSSTLGKSHSFGITSDGQTWAWGRNLSGQLGNSSITGQATPVRSGCLGDWAVIDTNDFHTLAIRSDGTAWSWGANQYGRLGVGASTSGFGQIGTDTDWKAVSAGAFHSLALKTNGTLWGWGNNENGQVGDGSGPYPYLLSPVQVGTDSDWAIISAQNRFSMAIKTDGTLWTWGDNDEGQLGLGSWSSPRVPTQVGTDSDWTNVWTSVNSTFAIKKNGTLWAWGSNGSGKLGDGTTTLRRSPVKVGTDNDWKIVAPGSGHTVAMKTNGTLWAWGWNQFGQVGDGTQTNRSTPVQVGSDTDWVSFGLGMRTTAALKANGELWAWGTELSGKRGPNFEWIQNATPARFGIETDWTALALGSLHTILLKKNGTVWGLGNNSEGQIGVGYASENRIPIQTAITKFTSKLVMTNSEAAMQQGQYNIFESNSSLIASVTSETGSPHPISGPVTAKVWIEAKQPEQYVRRHFEITPADDANEATGWVTLFFTQEEFNAFNAVNNLDLPTTPGNNTGIQNLLIEKRGGTSSDGSGRPSTYPGAVETIRPQYVVWNAANKWWEIGFKSTGFSGFFVKTMQEPLPVRLASFTVYESEKNALLKWKTAGEAGASYFDVERSTNAISFSKIGQVQAAGNSITDENYNFTDTEFSGLSGMQYYRLRMVDTDGSFSFSKIETLRGRTAINVYPNPVKRGSTVTVEANAPVSGLSVSDISGNQIPVRIRTRSNKKTEISLGSLPQGIYIFQFNSGDEAVSRKFVIE